MYENAEKNLKFWSWHEETKFFFFKSIILYYIFYPNVTHFYQIGVAINDFKSKFEILAENKSLWGSN
jgi:hypothetical protein